MKPIDATELLSIADFKAVRSHREKQIITTKAARTVALGPHMTLLFECRDTVWWQVQEMCRVEGIVAPEAVAHELSTYNALLPASGELSATLLIDVEEPRARDQLLRALVGLAGSLSLRLGGAEPVVARFDADQYSTERVSSVQFVRFSLDEAAQRAFSDLRSPAHLTVSHPAYQATVPLSGAVRGALVDDLNA